MGTYNFSVKELADIINDALDNAEGDFGYAELKDAWKLVVAAQQKDALDSASRRRSVHPAPPKSAPNVQAPPPPPGQ